MVPHSVGRASFDPFARAAAASSRGIPPLAPPLKREGSSGRDDLAPGTEVPGWASPGPELPSRFRGGGVPAQRVAGWGSARSTLVQNTRLEGVRRRRVAHNAHRVGLRGHRRDGGGVTAITNGMVQACPIRSCSCSSSCSSSNSAASTRGFRGRGRARARAPPDPEPVTRPSAPAPPPTSPVGLRRPVGGSARARGLHRSVGSGRCPLQRR